MTNQERITSHNNRLEAMKETVTGLPDAGIEPKVCTITVDTTNGGIIAGCVVNCYENNELIYKSIPYGTTSSIINLTNVICGSSFLLCLAGGGSYLKTNNPTNTESINLNLPSSISTCYGYKITANQNENIIIEVMSSEK